MPATLIVDGYGEPGDVPLGPVGSVIVAGLENTAAWTDPLAAAHNKTAMHETYFIGLTGLRSY
jgi:hypothetical protein